MIRNDKEINLGELLSIDMEPLSAYDLILIRGKKDLSGFGNLHGLSLVWKVFVK
jgi:hypothetical protein